MFRNEITTILTTSTFEEGKGGNRDGQVLHFGGPQLQIRNVNIHRVRLKLVHMG